MQEIRQLTLGKLKEIDEGSNEQGGRATSRRSSTASQEDHVVEVSDFLDADQIKMFTEELMPKEVLVKLNENVKRSKENVFVVHPIEGVTFALKELAKKVELNVFGLQCVKEADLESVGSLAKYYIKQIRKVQPIGPYNIAGYSFGCTIALEMALQLEKEDKKLVKNLIFLDGSHKYVSVQTAKYKDTKKVVEIGAENEADALCTFLMQFVSFEYIRVKEDLIALPSFAERVTRTAEFALKALPQVNIDEMKEAVKSFYRKLIIADNYTPESKFGGRAILIKALKNTFGEILGEDYSLSQVCSKPVEIHGIEGTHRSFITEPSVLQVATLINKM